MGQAPGGGRGDRAPLVLLARDGGAARDAGRTSRPTGDARKLSGSVPTVFGADPLTPDLSACGLQRLAAAAASSRKTSAVSVTVSA
ncbi:hypothetical protein [Streptomyces mirabilis]|uniref:hypothetical protein n=1 Tax=Streptomyces mirabilis TaxID=68239 RepID=UPI0036DECDC6